MTQGPHAQGSRLASVPWHPLLQTQSYPAACHGPMVGSNPHGSQLKSCSYFSGQIMPSLGKRAQPGNLIKYMRQKKIAWYRLKSINMHCLPCNICLLHLFVPLLLYTSILQNSYTQAMFISFIIP